MTTGREAMAEVLVDLTVDQVVTDKGTHRVIQAAYMEFEEIKYTVEGDHLLLPRLFPTMTMADSPTTMILTANQSIHLLPGKLKIVVLYTKVAHVLRLHKIKVDSVPADCQNITRQCLADMTATTDIAEETRRSRTILGKSQRTVLC